MSPAAVWVTRPAPGGRQTRRALESLGFSAVWVPLLQIGSATADLDPRPEWLIFTSKNAVRGWLNNGGNPSSVSWVAAVGAQTKALLQEHGIPCDLVPKDQRMAGLQHELAGRDFSGQTVLIPRGDQPESTAAELARWLTGRGAQAAAPIVYRVVRRKLSSAELEELRRWKPGASVVYSPSAAAAWAAAAQDELKDWASAPVIAVGPVTASALPDGAAVMTAEAPSDAGIAGLLRDVLNFPVQD